MNKIERFSDKMKNSKVAFIGVGVSHTELIKLFLKKGIGVTVLASFYQEESLQVSENLKWRIRHGFEQGKATPVVMLGYRLNSDDRLEIIPDEADIVRKIYTDYLSGMGQQMIANKLNNDGIKTKLGNEWDHAAVRRILQNEKYCGDRKRAEVYPRMLPGATESAWLTERSQFPMQTS